MLKMTLGVLKKFLKKICNLFHESRKNNDNLHQHCKEKVIVQFYKELVYNILGNRLFFFQKRHLGSGVRTQPFPVFPI